MDWQQIAPHFQHDGSLRDIYVLDTSIADWEAAWRFLSRGGGRLAFSVDGVSRSPPRTASEIFEVASGSSVLAAYADNGVTINCHFFTPSEIEFDVDPREIDGPVAFEAIARFITAIGEATSKPVVLTEENDRSMVIACFDPKTDVIG